MKFCLGDDIAEFATTVDSLVRRWLIPPPHSDMTDGERMEMMEQQVRQELVMEQIQMGLPQDLQARIDARGPTNVEELKQCIQEFQLQQPRRGGSNLQGRVD